MKNFEELYLSTYYLIYFKSVKEDDLIKSMEDVQKEGFNIHVHSMGDYATRVTINSIEKAQKYNEKGLRNIIAHCSFVKDEDKKRMGEESRAFSFQII